MRLVLLTILIFSIQVSASTGEGQLGEATMASIENDWGRSKDSFTRENTSHEEIRQLVENLLNAPAKSKIGEKSFPQADSSK